MQSKHIVQLVLVIVSTSTDTIKIGRRKVFRHVLTQPLPSYKRWVTRIPVRVCFVVPVLVLLLVALWFILRGDLLYVFFMYVFLCLVVCHFVLVFFSPFSIAITSLGEERANLSAFRTFVRFVLV